MNRIKNKFVLILLCFVLSCNTSKAKFSPANIIGYIPALAGAAVIAYCAKCIYKGEKEIVQEQVDELQSRTEQQRAVICAHIENLHKELDTLHRKTHQDNDCISTQEKKIISKLNQAHEELRAIDLHYQFEYVCIRSREKHITSGCAGGIMVGSIWMLMGYFIIQQ